MLEKLNAFSQLDADSQGWAVYFAQTSYHTKRVKLAGELETAVGHRFPRGFVGAVVELRRAADRREVAFRGSPLKLIDLKASPSERDGCNSSDSVY
jgi:hypothetical protein